MESSSKRLYFSAFRTEVAYDNGTLYVRRDLTYAYSPVSATAAVRILGGDTYLLETIERAIYPETVTSPRGLMWYEMPEDSVEMFPVNSSTIQSVGYDATNKTLYVEYDGGDVYEYAGVPENYWDGLKNADSKGSYIHWFIKIGEFPYKKVSGTRLAPASTALPNSGKPHPTGYMTGFKKTEKE